MWGKGLIKGLDVTWGHFWGKKETVSYPEEKIPMTERFRGGHLAMETEKCISCRLCATSCPNKALDLHIVTDEAKKRHMAEYWHDIGRCIYCGICVEVCPTQAIIWNKNFAIATYFKEDLKYDAVAEEREKKKEGGEPHE